MEKAIVAGVDLGGKQSGNTALCVLDAEAVITLQAQRGKDGHIWLHEQIMARKVTHVFIDAPLSLPGVYRGLKGYDDYHFRLADRQLGAMSPLFLGGLTASAMELAATWREKGITTVEVYPSALVRQLGLERYYGTRHSPETVIRFLEKLRAHPKTRKYLSQVNWNIGDSPSRHEADAILCFLSGMRFLAGNALSYGREEEGLMWV